MISDHKETNGLGESTEMMNESDSFWEPGNYKHTTKRVSDAYTLCNELVQMIQERGEIESKYAATLRHWSKKWNASVDKGAEYGTMANAWKSILNEADRLALLHIRMRERMESMVVSSIRQWQKDNFHKTIIRDFKEKKELEDAFKKAQKPWEKKLREVQRTKQEYHNACQKERTAAIREKNSIKDTSLSLDQKKKLEEDVFRLSETKQQNRDKYEKALRELNEYNSKYMEDMTDVYDKCAEMERSRLSFFKEEMKNLHRCLDISRDKNLTDIYTEFFDTLEVTDPDKDLRWYAKNHGVAMHMQWPTFQEFEPELKNISSKKNAKALAGAGEGDAIKLTGLQFKTLDDEVPHAHVHQQRHPNNRASTLVSKQCPVVVTKVAIPASPIHYPEDDWDEESLTDTADSGIPVCAMFDYEAVEDDELTFSRGEIFEKLEDEDDQGWCKGRKNGRVGLFPGGYVKGIPT